MTTVVNEVEELLVGRTPRAKATDEASWHDHWHEHGVGDLPPARMAVRGGLMARSLPQVFVAGYQAALRDVFPSLPAAGWAAFAAAEDRKQPDLYPGTTLRQQGDVHLLSGHKSWVGQSRHVAHLLVTAKQDGEDRIVALRAADPGVQITHRDAPSFLAGLSQGFARFSDAEVPLQDGAEPRDFGRTEPKYVMLACAAFLLADAQDDTAANRASALVIALADYAASGAYAPKTLAVLDRELQALAAAHDGRGVPDWTADRALIGMYSPRIQKRA